MRIDTHPKSVPNHIISDASRFWGHVNIQAHNDCWEWLAGKLKGYGVFSVGGKAVRAHRMALTLHLGYPLGTQVVRHTCDNRPCCNPAHLTAGTQKENIVDMMVKGRKAPTNGTLNAMHTLTWDGVREIRNLVSKGSPYKPLQDRYGVGKSCISGIVNNNTWKE